MKEKDFRKAVTDGILAVVNEYGSGVEPLREQLQKFPSVFHYGAWCERNFEQNLREDYERKTTFTSDLSIGEWCGSAAGVIDTLRRALDEWHPDIEFFAELIMAVNMKSWEHYVRKNNGWSKFYAELYYVVKDLYFDWFDESHKDHDKAIDYYMDFVD